MNVMQLQTVKYKVDKRKQTRESVSVKDPPADIRAQYAKTSEFTVMAFTPLTGKRSAAGKAKAKAKAKGTKK